MDTKTGEVKEFSDEDMKELLGETPGPDEFKPKRFDPYFKSQVDPLKSSWVDLNKIFAKGRVLEIDGTKWEIRRADIQPGKPGKMTLKLRGVAKEGQ